MSLEQILAEVQLKKKKIGFTAATAAASRKCPRSKHLLVCCITGRDFSVGEFVGACEREVIEAPGQKSWVNDRSIRVKYKVGTNLAKTIVFKQEHFTLLRII